MSPPIIWQKRLLIASPRPVPPYLRVGGGIGLGEFLEQPVYLLFGHTNAGVGDGNREPIAAIEPLRLRGNGDVAVFGKLVGIARQVQHRLPESDLVSMESAEIWSAIDHDPIAIFRCHGLDGLSYVIDQGR